VKKWGGAGERGRLARNTSESEFGHAIFFKRREEREKERERVCVCVRERRERERERGRGRERERETLNQIIKTREWEIKLKS
jgi:hypothetical protein